MSSKEEKRQTPQNKAFSSKFLRNTARILTILLTIGFVVIGEVWIFILGFSEIWSQNLNGLLILIIGIPSLFIIPAFMCAFSIKSNLFGGIYFVTMSVVVPIIMGFSLDPLGSHPSLIGLVLQYLIAIIPSLITATLFFFSYVREKQNYRKIMEDEYPNEYIFSRIKRYSAKSHSKFLNSCSIFSTFFPINSPTQLAILKWQIRKKRYKLIL